MISSLDGDDYVVPVTRWCTGIDDRGRVTISGDRFCGEGDSIRVVVDSLDTANQIISSGGSLMYLFTKTEKESTEYSILVSYLLRGIVPRFTSPYPSRYHNAGKVDLNLDVWWLITRHLGFADRSALRATARWYHTNIPIFMNTNDRNLVIDSLVFGKGNEYWCEVPIPTLFSSTSEVEASAAVDSIIHCDLPTVAPFFAMLMLRASRCTTSTLKTVPMRYLTNNVFVKIFLKYLLLVSWGEPSNTLSVVLGSLRDLPHAVRPTWVKAIVAHPQWDWYLPQTRNTIKHIVSKDYPEETMALVPMGLPCLLDDFVEMMFRCKSYKTGESLLTSDKLIMYYMNDPTRTYPVIKKIATWLCRRYKMNDAMLTRMYTVWDPILTASHKKKLYQSLKDVLSTRKGCVKTLTRYENWGTTTRP